jgi:hypothetical protein
MPWSAGYITNMFESEFSPHTVVKILMGLLLRLPMWPEVGAIGLRLEALIRSLDLEAGFDSSPLRRRRRWRTQATIIAPEEMLAELTLPPGRRHRILPCAPRSSSASHASCMIALALVSLSPFCLPRHRSTATRKSSWHRRTTCVPGPVVFGRPGLRRSFAIAAFPFEVCCN